MTAPLAALQHVSFNKHPTPRELPAEVIENSLSDSGLNRLAQRDGRVQLGTLGRGNHFLEFQSDEQGRLWVTVHSGSRAMGQDAPLPDEHRLPDASPHWSTCLICAGPGCPPSCFLSWGPISSAVESVISGIRFRRVRVCSLESRSVNWAA